MVNNFQETILRELEYSDNVRVKRAQQPLSITCGDLMELNFPPQEWIWQKCLPRGELAVLSGSKGCGKTNFALNLCLSASMGNPFLDIPTTKTKCLYISLELGKKLIQSRILKSGLQVPNDELTFCWDWPRLPEGSSNLLEIVEERQIGLVVIDVLAKMRPQGANWDKYGEAYDTISPLREVAQKTNSTILLLTHNRKGESDDPTERILGSIGLAGTSGVILSLKTRIHQRSGLLEISGNDVEYQKIPVVLQTNPLRYERSSENPDEVDLSVEKREVYRVIQNLGQAKVSDIVKTTGKSQPNVSQLVRRLVESGLVISVKTGVYALVTQIAKQGEYDLQPEGLGTTSFSSASKMEDG